MSVTVSDLTEIECELLVELLQQRYSKRALSKVISDELPICPTLYWSKRGAHFVVSKVATNRYRCHFFYADADQYGTCHDEYTDLWRCVLTLLRVQADQKSQDAWLILAEVARENGREALDPRARTSVRHFAGARCLLRRNPKKKRTP